MLRPDNNQKGMAMLVVIWALVLLIALGTEFAFSMKTEVNTTRNFKEDIESYHLAKAGLALARAEILQPADYHGDHAELGMIVGTELADPAAQPLFPAQGQDGETAAIAQPLPVRTNIELGSGTVSYTIIDENRKIPINSASREVLVRALLRSGVENEEDIDIIADSILDWIDADDNHRINGTENDYYLKLNPPTPARNGPIQVLEELLQVRGMTREIFYGGGQVPQEGPPQEGSEGGGFRRFFTLYNVGPVNPNTADEGVLSLLFDPAQIEEIMANREEFGYHNATLSTFFRIVSTGRVTGSPTQHTLVAVVQKTGSADEPALITHYWNDNWIDYENDLH
jgi:general secretion pathway protein K